MNSEPDYLKLIFTNIPEPRILLHTNFPFLSIIMYNKAFENAILKGGADLAGLPFSSVLGLNETDSAFTKLLPFFERSIKEGDTQIIPIEDKLSLENNVPIVLPDWQLSINPMPGPDRQAQFILVTLQQKSTLLEKNKELRQSNEKLIKSNQELLESKTSLQNLAVELEEKVMKRSVALAESELNLHNLVISARYMLMILKGHDWVVELANQQVATLWNKELKDILGRKLLEILPEIKDQAFPALLEKVFESGESYGQGEEPFHLSTDKGILTKYVSFYYDPVKDERGKVSGIIVAAEDITEKVEARRTLEKILADQQLLSEELFATNEELSTANEELLTINDELEQTQINLQQIVLKLVESEARVRFMLSEAPIAICVFAGKNMIIESANAKILQIWGKDDSVIGKPLSEALPELEGQLFLPKLAEVYTTGEVFYGNEIKALLKRSNKVEEVYSNFVYQPLKDVRGETTRIMLVANEVTEQVTAKRKVEKAEEMLRFSIEAANLGTWSLDITTRKFSASDRIKELFGYLPEEMITAESGFDLIPGEHRERVLEVYKEAVKNGEGFAVEHPIIGFHDKKMKWVKVFAKLNQDSADLPYFTGIMMDITEQKLDEIRKSDFIGMVSHELKTPLTSLKGYVQMLHERARVQDDAHGSNALNKVEKQVNKMTNLINGFLNVSRLESGKIFLHKHDFDLTALIEEILDETKVLVSTHPFYWKSHKTLMVCADRDKIGSVISNFLSNAVKYSPKGKLIEIACEERDGQAYVQVKDEGYGVHYKDLDKLFERYYRAENSQIQTVSGFGIGLYLCAEIVERHHGEIGVTSKQGTGSQFFFSIPMN